MAKILFARMSNDSPEKDAKYGFDAMSKFKLHGDAHVAAALAAGYECIDVSDGSLWYDPTLKAYYDIFDFDFFAHVGHGLYDTMWGDYNPDIHFYDYVSYMGVEESMTCFTGKAVYSFSCETSAQLLPQIKAWGAVAVAGFSGRIRWGYDPFLPLVDQGGLSDTVMSSFMTAGFKFIDSVIAGNTWVQAYTDTRAEYDTQIAYWESGAGSTHPLAITMASALNGNKGMLQYDGTFQITGGVPTTGTINVSTNNASATFSLSGAASYSGSGSTWIQEGATAGSYTIIFGAVAGYNTPANQTGTLGAGETLTFTATYTAIPTTGTINVSTNLSGATFSLAGANTYSGSGTSWSQASATAGLYTITYGAVAGYNTPPQEIKTLTAGSSITFTGTYTAISTDGTIVVTTDIGAPFSIDGPETFIGSGTSWSNNTASPGTYTITFAAVIGFESPTPQTGVLTAGGTLTFSHTYVPITYGGTVNVSTNLSSATFTITGPEVLTGSGTTWSDTGVTAGSYTIVYGAVAGYTKPTNETQALVDGSSVTFTGTYVAAANVGTIEVSTNNSSATFTVTGYIYGNVYSGSGTSWTQTNAVADIYIIAYGNVAGYSTPANATKALAVGLTITFSATYNALATTGTITVTTNNDNASFSIVGENTYSSTGRSYSVATVPTGPYTITYGDISGYTTPSQQSGTLTASGTLNFNGTYNPLLNAPSSTSDIPSIVSGLGLGNNRLLRLAEDPKHFYRNDNQSTQVPFSLMPIIPPIPLHAHTNRWEFKSAYDVNTNVWAVTQVGTGTALAIQNERGGVAKFVNGGNDDDFYSYFSIYEVSKVYSGLWLNASIKIKDVDEADWYFGLCTRLTPGAYVFDNRIDTIGFYGSDGSGSINAECKKDFVATQETGLGTLADSTFTQLHLYVEGTQRVFFYVDGFYKKNIVTHIPDDEEMCVVFGCRNGKREANEFTISQINLFMDI